MLVSTERCVRLTFACDICGDRIEVCGAAQGNAEEKASSAGWTLYLLAKDHCACRKCSPVAGLLHTDWLNTQRDTAPMEDLFRAAAEHVLANGGASDPNVRHACDALGVASDPNVRHACDALGVAY